MMVSGCIRVSFETRADGGLRIWSDDIPGLVLSHADRSAVWRDLGRALEVILDHDQNQKEPDIR